ncbi:MAG: hypothetical protein V4616_07460 [Bacteroidota bacterium]
MKSPQSILLLFAALLITSLGTAQTVVSLGIGRSIAFGNNKEGNIGSSFRPELQVQRTAAKWGRVSLNLGMFAQYSKLVATARNPTLFIGGDDGGFAVDYEMENLEVGFTIPVIVNLKGLELGVIPVFPFQAYGNNQVTFRGNSAPYSVEYSQALLNRMSVRLQAGVTQQAFNLAIYYETPRQVYLAQDQEIFKITTATFRLGYTFYDKPAETISE